MGAFNAVAPVYAEEGDDLYLPKRGPNADKRSKLQRSKEAAAGQVVNACQFGCEDHELDERGYCRHIAGTTKPGDDTVFFPLKPRIDPKAPDRPPRFHFTDGSDPQFVQPGDKLVLERVAYRVYRDDKPMPALTDTGSTQTNTEPVEE